MEDIHAITEIRGKRPVRLMQEQPWDFFMVVFRNSDEICHFYWHHMDETHPNHDPEAPARYKTAILDLYQHIDQWVGRIVETAGEDVNVLIMSDHGAGPLYQDVFLNEWLIEQGVVNSKRRARRPALLVPADPPTGLNPRKYLGYIDAAEFAPVGSADQADLG